MDQNDCPTKRKHPAGSAPGLIPLICAALVMGCGDTTPAEQGSSDTGSGDDADIRLTPNEISIVLNQLGPLPARAPADPSNAYADDPAAAQLGEALFFDARYSSDGQTSCATCHDPNLGFQDARGLPTSTGVAGVTGRHAPTVIGGAWGSGEQGTWQFWDGRKDSQWSQALGPPESPVEMGSTRTRVVRLLVEEYGTAYTNLFGPFAEALFDQSGNFAIPDSAMPGSSTWESLSPESRAAINRAYANFGKAIAAYERKVRCADSPFDAYWQALKQEGSDSNSHLSAAEKRGLKLFIGKADCLECHSGRNFSDWQFHNLGIDQSQLGQGLPNVDAGQQDGVASVLNDEFNCQGPYSDAPDPNQCAIAGLHGSEGVEGGFKTPSLRCVAISAPYMHTGSLNSLEAVMEHYRRGGDASGFVGESELVPLPLTDDEINDLVAFMLALGSTVVVESP